MDIIPDNLIEVIGLTAMAVILGFTGIRKILKDWQSTEAEVSVINIMHAELERMSEQNTALSLELGRLHNEIISLNHELQNLSMENRRLQTEVVALTIEVSSFKKMREEEANGKIKTN